MKAAATGNINELSLENLVLSRGGRTIINGFTASAVSGDVVALLGPNGVGKTTMLHAIAGILNIDAGDINCNGLRSDKDSLEWRRRLNYVLDDRGVIPLLTVEEQIFLQCLLVGVSHSESIERTRLVIELLELNKVRKYRADELSSGLCKRLGIGLGIVRDADIFLFDEPFNSLDIQAIEIFSQIIMTLKNRGRIILVASHSFPHLSSLCTQIWDLSSGSIWHESNAQISTKLLSQTSHSAVTNSGEEIYLPWILKSK